MKPDGAIGTSDERSIGEIGRSKIIYARNEKALASARAYDDRLHRGTIPLGFSASGQGRARIVIYRAEMFQKRKLESVEAREAKALANG